MRGHRHIAIWVLLLSGMALVAQPRLRTPEIYVGAQAGVLASMVNFSPTVEGIDPLTAPLTPNGGLVFRYAGHKVCAIQVELNYMQRGWHEGIAATDSTAGVDYRRQLHYIEVPLLMHLYVGKEHWRGFINLGPQVGYCFMDRQSGTQSTTDTHQYESIQQRFDWGIAGGVGFYYRHERVGIFQLEARFNYSMGGVFNTHLGDYFSSANPMDLSLNFAYMWQVKVK